MKTYLIRWRGRIEGPLTLEQIDSRLAAGQLGMLTQIQLNGQWITLRQFYKSPAAAEDLPMEQPSPPAPQADPINFPQLSDKIAFSPLSKSSTTNRVLVASFGVIVLCLLAGYFGFVRPKQKQSSSTADGNQSSTNITLQPTSPPPLTNDTALPIPPINEIATSAPTVSNVPIVSSDPLTNKPPHVVDISNSIPSEVASSLPPLPEHEPRLFCLKNNSNYLGSIFHVDGKGLIIKLTSGKLTSRLPWDLFDEAALAREPKVLAIKKAQEAARLAAEQAIIAAAEAAEKARIAAAEAAEKARAEKAEAERLLAEYRNRQDNLIDDSIRKLGWKSITRGYLKAWGDQVTIGEIFSVVAPSAQWSAGKLASNESERYSHYLVEAKWINDNGERVAMQYLVTADGSNFHLHGCFVAERKLPDLQFLLAVKEIWQRKR